MTRMFRDEYLRTPPEPRPNRRLLEGAIADAVYRSGVPRGDIEREIVHRVLGALGPVLALVDLFDTDDDELAAIFDRPDPSVLARLRHDPQFAMLANYAIHARRELKRLQMKERIDLPADEADAVKRLIGQGVDPDLARRAIMADLDDG